MEAGKSWHSATSKLDTQEVGYLWYNSNPHPNTWKPRELMLYIPIWSPAKTQKEPMFQLQQKVKEKTDVPA
jgi:hypothetical protein